MHVLVSASTSVSASISAPAEPGNLELKREKDRQKNVFINLLVKYKNIITFNTARLNYVRYYVVLIRRKG